MTSKPTEPDNAAGANSTIHDSTEPSSSAEPAAVTRSLAGANGGVSSSPNVGGQKGIEDGAKTPRNSGKRRDKSKPVEPSEPPVDSPESRETDPGTVDRVDLPEEQAETFGAFLRWLYAAYIGVTCVSLSSSTISLFQLYAFACKYTINVLEDAIISTLYDRFAIDDALWLTLGSDKRALETLLRVIPSEAHLYRLVVRSLAYSMRLRTERQWPEPGDAWRSSTLPRTPATASQVEKVMESVPSELWGPISKEVLLVKTLGAWRQGFASTVGYECEFLRRHEDLVNDGPSASGW